MKNTKIIRLFICLILVVVMSVGCFGRTELDESFSETEIIELAETVLNEVRSASSVIVAV